MLKVHYFKILALQRKSVMENCEVPVGYIMFQVAVAVFEI
jgi:hypothetical protein